ncbi:MAG: response regulator transcription factor [Leptonema illini]|uniref:Two component transcriptional regulator, LuxR family n=2 Tax=Leptonema illini TaxID=183 RepID=H2CAI1_9LEPT|nr:response regulator transcription factor [Leptonema illini]EHQ07348.1 two component transcriptional regulator, LuxR family [Leptonema illini DSM 21528]KAB2932929.1 MAG: response regulator transcription factor [Leptonema illini]PKL34548.1 MAG: DNA-binding response regulator [Spirochaetae bacterium HGW-Spirochaetae-10]
MKETRLYLADDHAIVREGLRFILSSQPHYKIVGESGDGPIALQQIEEIKPDIAILDISLPGMTGIEIARQIRRYHPDIRIIMLSRHDNEEYLRELLKYKIHGYVLKDEAGSDLIRAIDAVMSGETYLSPRMVSMLVREKEAGTDADTGLFSLLSNREREILKLLAEGKTNEEIGTQLRISPHTAKVHRQNIMKKLNLHKTADLVRYAVRTGLIEG